MRPSRLADLMTLIRLPNLFTVAADVLMGLFLAGRASDVMLQAGATDSGTFTVDPFAFALFFGGDRLALLMIPASICLYMAGVVLNDVFDVEIDRRERPGRPLPAGRISVRFAAVLGWVLLALGVGLVAAICSLFDSFLPLIVGVVLAGCIVAYDTRLKHTLGGPIVMGACRGLNILMAMSIVGHLSPGRILIACAISVYIAGVTWYARDEADQPRPGRLIAATVVMLLGVALLAALPLLHPWDHSMLMENLTAPGMPVRWLLAVGALLMATAWHCSWAIQNPSPAYVQAVVGRSIAWLIFIDGLIVVGGRNLIGGVLICFLYLLARSVRKMFPST